MPKPTFFNLPDEKREWILECAIDEFAEQPYENASISRIVRNAKIAKGSFYQYFDDKMDLFLYILKVAGELKMNYLKKLEVKLEGVDFFERFRGLLYGGFMFAKAYPRLSKIGAHLMKSENKELRERLVSDNRDMATAYYGSMIERGIKDGSIRGGIDQEFVGYMMFKMIFNVTEYYFQKFDADDYDDENHELQKMLDQIMDLIKNGIGT